MRLPRWLAGAGLTLLLAALVLPPILTVLRTSLLANDPVGPWTLAGYASLFSGSTYTRPAGTLASRLVRSTVRIGGSTSAASSSVSPAPANHRGSRIPRRCRDGDPQGRTHLNKSL